MCRHHIVGILEPAVSAASKKSSNYIICARKWSTWSDISVADFFLDRETRVPRRRVTLQYRAGIAVLVQLQMSIQLAFSFFTDEQSFFSAAMMQGEFWQCNPYYRAGLISHILVPLQVRSCALSSWYSSTALVLILSVVVPCCILPHCVIVEIREVCVNIALCTNFVIENAHTLNDFVKYKLCVDDGDAIRCGNRVPYDASIFRVAPLVLL